MKHASEGDFGLDVVALFRDLNIHQRGAGRATLLPANP